ncbi:MAG: hypothetical protein QW279_11420 [Candidatus Jordarchaeaceae archaeon]
MQVFGFSYECYVPDTQILFPHVFLRGIQKLSANNVLYKSCVNRILENNIRLAILPSNHYEFNNLIMEKFRAFLKDIAIMAIKYTQQQKFSIETRKLIRSKIANNEYPSDFLVYWDSKSLYFSQWLTLDERSIRKQQYNLILQILENFNEIVDNAEINVKNWKSPDIEKEAKETFETLKTFRNNNSIPSNAHDEDLYIISDCIVYRNHYLETGIIYLITNDNSCFEALKKIIRFEDDKGQKFCASGIDCVKPSDFVKKVEDSLKKRTKTRA